MVDIPEPPRRMTGGNKSTWGEMARQPAHSPWIASTAIIAIIHVHIHIIAIKSIIATAVGSKGARILRHFLYEAFIRLAQTRLSQNALKLC